MQKLRINIVLQFVGLFALISIISPVSAIPAPGKDDEKASDYDYTGDEEVPAEQKKPIDDTKPTPIPFFNEKIANLFAKRGDNVSLECPVKNYNEVTHSFLWYKEDVIVANGFSPTVEGYTVDKNLTLHIGNFSNAFSGNYYCTIMPHNVRRQIIVEVGDPSQVQQTTTTEMAKLDNLEKPAKASNDASSKGSRVVEPLTRESFLILVVTWMGLGMGFGSTIRMGGI